MSQQTGKVYINARRFDQPMLGWCRFPKLQIPCQKGFMKASVKAEQIEE